MTPLISVIIPVYKVEEYLRRCLDSVVAQTYKNLEIILVDDGSPDNCGAICDEYASQDDRIVVIHQKNSGLSGARNSALEIASGEFFGFVDSDDWIEPDMYEYLLTHAIETDADISFCGRIVEYPNRSVGINWPQIEVMDTEAAIKNLLEDKILHNVVWDKLWRRELFDDVRFPVGRTFEDMAVAHRLFCKARRVVMSPGRKYHYMQREGSILADTSISNRINCFLAARQRYNEMIGSWPQYRSLLVAQCLASTVSIWCGYYFSPVAMRKQCRAHLQEISDFAKVHLRDVYRQTNLGLAGRIVLRLVSYTAWWSFAMAGVIGWLYKVKNGRVL